MLRPRVRSKVLKKPPNAPQSIARAKAIDCDKIEIWFAQAARIGQKNKITLSLGKAWHPSQRSSRSAHRINLYLRCRLPQGWQGGSLDPAKLQYRGDEPAPRGDRQRRRTQRPRRPLWSIRLAGTYRRVCSCRPTSPLSPCRRNAPSSIRSRTSGSSCAEWRSAGNQVSAIAAPGTATLPGPVG